MVQTLSTFFDSKHFFHPTQKPEGKKFDHPSLQRRIAGVILAVFSLAFTLGIATIFYGYWAHRKVVHVEKQHRSDLEERVQEVFGKKIEGTESTDAEDKFAGVVKAIQRNSVKTVTTAIDQLPEEFLQADALMRMALEYDHVSAAIALMKKYEDITIPLTEVKSGRMVEAIMQQLPEGDKESLLNGFDDDGNTALHLQTNLAVVKALVEAGADYLPNVEGFFPLYTCKDSKIAEFLIDHFGDDILNSGPRSPLFTVPPSVMRVMIERGADVTVFDGDRSILFRFIEDAFCNDVELMELILSKIEDDKVKKQFVNYTCRIDYDDIAPLSMACHPNANVAIIKLLVEAGAKYCFTSDAWTLLKDPDIVRYLAQQFKDKVESKIILRQLTSPLFLVKDAELLKVLVEEGLDVQATDRDGNSILHYLGEPHYRDHPELVSLIVDRVPESERDAFVHASCSSGLTAMERNPGLEMMRALKEAGAEIPTHRLLRRIDIELLKNLVEVFGNEILNFRRKDLGETPIFGSHTAEVLTYMIEQGADVKVRNRSGETIFHQLVRREITGGAELVRLIISKVDESEKVEFVNSRNQYGETPASYAEAAGAEILRALKEAGAEYPVDTIGYTPLHFSRDLPTVKMYVEVFGQEVVCREEWSGQTPLFYGHPAEVMEYLIEQGADLKHESYGKNALYYAKSVEVAKLFIRKGIDPQSVTKSGENLLCGNISAEVARYLIDEHGLDIHHKDNSNKEPIHHVSKDNIELAKVLIGNRRSDHDWGGVVPRVMENPDFIAWLKERENKDAAPIEDQATDGE